MAGILCVFLLCACGNNDKVQELPPEPTETITENLQEAEPSPQQIVIVSDTEVMTEDETTADLSTMVTGTMYVMGDRVNIRKGPSTDAEKQAVFQPVTK